MISLLSFHLYKYTNCGPEVKSNLKKNPALVGPWNCEPDFFFKKRQVYCEANGEQELMTWDVKKQKWDFNYQLVFSLDFCTINSSTIVCFGGTQPNLHTLAPSSWSVDPMLTKVHATDGG